MSKYVGVFVGLLLLSSQAAFAYNYVSVAAVRLTNPDGSPRGHYGKGWSDDADQAEETAMQACGYADCKVLSTTSGCVALAYDSGKRVMSSTGDDIESAQSNVNNYCQSSSTVGGCVLWVTLCADGYDSEQ